MSLCSRFPYDGGGESVCVCDGAAADVGCRVGTVTRACRGSDNPGYTTPGCRRTPASASCTWSTVRNTDGKVDGNETEDRPTCWEPDSPCSGPVWSRERRTGSSARCSNADQSRVKTGSVQLARVWSRKWAASLLTLWVVWFIHLVAGVLRSSRNSGSFQWS